MGLLQTACLSDWLEFMIRVLRHDSHGACHSEPPLPKDAWRDKEWQGGLREIDWFEFMIRMLRHDSRGACHSEPPLPKDAWRDRERQGSLREMYFTGDFICTQKYWFKFK
ncbi:hypothetical protein CDAR_264471 [Caerostris darwini]|uniref:Uncharacterized protein n=1 Tax=Caerostris darwini TaxID=1538125 RepID=A0AAV4TL08_9ARAC|nr:hypothetical protein CDAR_264471 [Caerostris darwini]